MVFGFFYVSLSTLCSDLLGQQPRCDCEIPIFAARGWPHCPLLALAGGFRGMLLLSLGCTLRGKL